MTLRILFNGRIYANFAPDGLHTAIALNDHGVLAAGTDRDVLDAFPYAEHKVNLNGHTVLPGLIDSHIHITRFGAALSKVNCETRTKSECLSKLSAAVGEAVPGTWILGYGWNHNTWPEGIGSRQELDRISTCHPIYLTSKSLHSAWVNSKAIELAHINQYTSNPTGGEIVRGPNGEPTGILLESAMRLIEEHIPALSVDQTIEVISLAQEKLWQSGITGIHDFDPVISFIALQQMKTSGNLALRTTKYLPVDILDQILATGLQSGFGDSILRFGGIKIFSDGALGPQTAAMLAPYENGIDNYGVLLEDQESIYETGLKANGNGLSMSIHAIGDKANHEVLQAFTHLKQDSSISSNHRIRNRVEHVQVIHPDDLKMLAKSQVIASMQPIHVISDMEMAIDLWGSRTRWAYAWNSVLQNVISPKHFSFGSDAPVDLPNPFLGISAALNRMTISTHGTEIAISPQEKISMGQILNAYTIGAAYAGYFEKDIGQLLPGFQADLIILPFDPFLMPPDQLANLLPLATMIGNQWVWIDPDNTTLDLQ